MKSCEATGKTIEQAINNALLELKAAREDVDIKILNEGGFLKKAKVCVSISEDALDKYEKKEALKKTISEENDEGFAEKFVKTKIEKTEAETLQKTEEKPAEKVAATKEEAKKVQSIEKQSDEVSNESEEPVEKTEKIEKKLSASEFIDGILAAMNVEGKTERIEADRVVRYSLTGDNLNELIGRHGECLMSLSYIMSLVCKNENKKKVVLDVENYRQKREESLTALAKRTADKVAKSGRYYKFEPMEPSERRIIHLALQNDDRVTTLSKGEDPKRYLIVFPKEYKD
jgi:spoIIIJ-associated protein